MNKTQKITITVTLIFSLILLLATFIYFYGKINNKLRDAIYKKDIQMLKTLLASGENLERRTLAGDTPLHIASVHVDTGVLPLEFVDCLVKAGSNVNAKNNCLETPLHCAHTNLELVRYLVEHGADVNARDKKLQTPLHCAKNVATAEYLLKNGADLEARDINCQTPLFRAETAPLLRFLLDKGAKTNAVSADGDGILHKKVRNDENINLVKLLVLRDDTYMDAINKNRKTAVDLADVKIKNFLISYKNDPEKIKAEIKKELEELVHKEKNTEIE